MSQPLGNFAKYIGTWYEHYVLPVIPVRATLKIKMDGSTVDPTQLGKVPGQRHRGEWSGFRDWTAHRTHETDLIRWQNWSAKERISACMRTAEMPAIDCDVDNYEDAAMVEMIITNILGPSAIRKRNNSPRFAVFFKWKAGTPPIRGRHLNWFVDEAANDVDGVDFLGDGQETLTDGWHKTGAVLEWPNGDLLEWEGKLTEVTALQFSQVYNAIAAWAEAKGYPLKGRVAGDFEGGFEGETYEVGNLDILSPIALDFKKPGEREKLVMALDAISPDHPELDYDGIVTLLRAIKASCNGDQDFMVEVVHPWICRQTIKKGTGDLTKDRDENGMVWLQDRWNSFTTSALGWDYVEKWALAGGSKEIEEIAAAEAAQQATEIFGHGDTTGEHAEGTDGSPGEDRGEPGVLRTGADAEGDRAADLPDHHARIGGPIPPRDTHWPLAEEFAERYGRTWRWVREAKAWYSYQEGAGIWAQDDHIGSALRHLLRERAAELRGGTEARAEDRARALDHVSVSNGVESLLRRMPGMTCSVEDFDSQPHLMNTPERVYDLRDGTSMEHSPDLLMRWVTATGPDIHAIIDQDYRGRCPQWFDVLDHLANGRDWFIPGLRAALAYTLSGEINRAAMLFMQGLPGIGKTVVFQVLYNLAGTYGLVRDGSFYGKHDSGGKRFDMADIVGKRMLFTDEVPQNMVWDEMRMCVMVTGRQLAAEIKNGKRFTFTNTAKICIVGNHRPNFVSPDAGGLTSRMLMVNAEGEMIRDTVRDNDVLPDEITENEGAAIMAWLLEASIEDHANPRAFRIATTEMKQAAREYAADNSIFRQWVEFMGLEVSPERYMNTTWAYEKFVEYARDQRDPGRHKLDQFKTAISAAYPSVHFDKDTMHHGRGNKATCFGMGKPDALNPAEMAPESVEMSAEKSVARKPGV